MYDDNGKILNAFRSMHINISAYIRVNGSKNEFFEKILFMSPCLFNVYMDGVMKKRKDGENGSETIG